MSSCRAAYLDKAGAPLRIADAKMPTPGPNDIVIRNRAIAINPLDAGQAASGYMIKSFPRVLGCDVAGEIHAVGSAVTRFRVGDRVVGAPWVLLTDREQDGGFREFSNVPAANAALVPDSVAFKEATVLPVAITTAVHGLFSCSPGMALDLPVPTTDGSRPPHNGKVVIVYGASSSVGLCTVQLAAAAGCRVVGIAGAANSDIVRSAGADVTIDYRHVDCVKDAVSAVGSDEFVGLYDSIGTEASHKIVVPILQELKRGSLCTTKALPAERLPEEVQTKRMFGIGDFTFPLWEQFIPKALATGQLKCLPPPLVVGQGLESIQPAMERLRAGVSAQKIVVEL